MTGQVFAMIMVGGEDEDHEISSAGTVEPVARCADLCGNTSSARRQGGRRERPRAAAAPKLATRDRREQRAKRDAASRHRRHVPATAPVAHAHARTAVSQFEQVDAKRAG